ncbi:hypothetical protein ACFE04_022044 [Oxalis oulophora]
MAASHFFKHLTCTAIPRRLFNTHSSSFSPLTLLTAQLHTTVTVNCKQRHQILTLTNPISVITHFNKTNSYTNSSRLYASTTNEATDTYLSVRIHCHINVADELSEALLCFGAYSASMDEEDEDGCENTDQTYIESIFPNSSDVVKCISQAAHSIGLKETPRYEANVYEKYDWIKKYQESFQPVEVTKGFWVVPEWITPPDPEATNIILNPGLAFGAGDHPTTKLCLLLLKGSIKGGERILDYGTGSGVLAIAALKFGAEFSVGVDIDPQAIETAHLNATLNNMGSDKMELHLVTEEVGQEQGLLSGTEKYDFIIANILLNPLLELADHIVCYAKPGAIVGLSGILSEQVPQIIDRYSKLLEDISTSKMDGWACVSGKKKRNL